jgi:predicted GNAT family acetyltransferase
MAGKDNHDHGCPGPADQCDDGSVSDSPEVTDNVAASRLELAADGQLALLSYRLRGDRFVCLHTEVPEALGGQGLGGVLVTAAIGRAEREKLTVVPLCPFARGWLQRHPDAAARVSVDWGGQAPPG